MIQLFVHNKTKLGEDTTNLEKKTKQLRILQKKRKKKKKFDHLAEMEKLVS